ncbi:hypothetical protein ANCCEY_02028 [Ancylostoma ceylanicum]|uniref:C2H2-type domain-containing protein n=1 Tax=Ancylostoma ceylanicum TaxID=53326 RepID=A0A0D6M8U6_9BILA|nr:hypothetical protein ANCCEY_02028 [Ancylostoma ceylanicum]
MDVESSLSMATCRIAEPAAVAAVEDLIPPSMETNSGDPCTLTDLSSCNAIPEDQPGWTYQNDLFSELDYQGPSTSNYNADGIPIEQYGSETTEYQQDDYDPTYKYYYMLEDSHEDVLKKLENELLREEIEEQEKAEAAEKRMQELEKGAEEFVHITELKNKRDRHSKMSQEKRAEKERIIQLRKELAMANREREIFCCFVCSRVFADEEGMREHVAEKHLANKKEYFLKCSKCYQRFNKKQHLQRHELTHKNTAYTCRVCSREFRGVVSLKIHMSSAHSMSLDGVHISRELACKCGQKFGVVEELKRHRYYCETRESIAEKRRKAREELDALSTISPTHSASSVYSESTSAASIGSASGRPVKGFDFACIATIEQLNGGKGTKFYSKTRESHSPRPKTVRNRSPALFSNKLLASQYNWVDRDQLLERCLECRARRTGASCVKVTWL